MLATVELELRYLKGIGVLAGAAVVVIGGVVGLAEIFVDDSPTFAEEVAAATDLPPTAVGAELEVTGDRPGTLSMQGPGPESGGTSGDLSGDSGQIDLGQDAEEGVFIDHLTWDGLDFFLDPGDCQIETGETNEGAGITRVDISCVDIRDVRDTATITVEGPANLPLGVVSVEGLPAQGGTLVMTGAFDQTFTFEGGQTWSPQPDGVATGQEFSLYLFSPTISLGFAFDADVLTLARVVYREIETDIPPDSCSVTHESLGRLDPMVTLVDISFYCDTLDLDEVGTVTIDGSVVVQRHDM